MKRRTLTTTDLLRRSPPFSGPIRVDAAAKVDEDEVFCDGGRARAAVGFREEEDEEGEE